MIRYVLLITLLIAWLAACQQEAVTPTPTPEAMPTAVMLEPSGQIQRIHDPVIANENGTYYVFSTGPRILVICSEDKVTWEHCGRVFERNPAWVREINPNLSDIWAPDISFFNGRWHLYYAASNFGTQNSAIGLATNATLDPQSPDFEWQDHGIVLRSQPGDPWNAIDPNLVLDENGAPWLAWGSFWSGIWLARVDPATGMLSAERSEYHHIADRSAGNDNTSAIEAAFIVPHDGKWYLFVSFDQCCQGVESTYNVRIGRSDSLTGPYVDQEGVPLMEGGGTLILSEYGQWKGPGHNGLIVEDDLFWMVYHAYDSKQIGIPKLRIESIAWTADGWPTLPSQTQSP